VRAFGLIASMVPAPRRRRSWHIQPPPTVGVTINLIYSSLGTILFGWWLVRWYRDHRQAR
jgi:hypothetical protein